MGLETIATIAGLAASAGGAVTQEVAAGREKSAMNDAVQQQLNAQSQYAKQGQDVFNKSLANSTPAEALKQITQGQQQSLGGIQQAQAVPLSASMPSLGATDSATQVAKTGMSNTAAANYQGYSNYPLQQQLGNLQTNSQLGLINNQASQSASNLPFQLASAQNSQSGLNGLGQLIGAGGGLLSSYGIGAAPVAKQALAPGAQSMLNNIQLQSLVNTLYPPLSGGSQPFSLQ